MRLAAAGARARMEESAAAVQATVDSGRVAYGINTGFGAFANRVIPANKTRKLQFNLVRSHACGVGEPLDPRARAPHAAAQGERPRGGFFGRAPARRRGAARAAQCRRAAGRFRRRARSARRAISRRSRTSPWR